MTTLIHTPAHTTDYPDRFDDETAGQGYSVRHDTDAEDPRARIEPEHAALWAYREPSLRRSVAADRPEGNVAIDAFARYFESFDETKSLELTRRYLATFHAEKKISVDIATIRGYCQSDWLDVVCATTQGYGLPASHIDEFRRWAFGDVWLVIPDGKPGICGIYADDAEEALKHYRTNFEDDAPADTGTSDAQTSAATWPEDDDERAAFGDWQYEVANSDTLLGFRDWITHRDESQDSSTQP